MNLKRFLGFFEKRDDVASSRQSRALAADGWLQGRSSPRNSEQLSAVLACTNAIATALAYVPVVVYRIDGDKRIETSTHPLCKLSRIGANAQMTWSDFIEHLVASALLTGNGLATIERSGNGQLSGLTFAPWNYVTVNELSSGRLAYDVRDGNGSTRRYLEGEVIHLRDRTDDGKIGRSRLSRAAETVDAVYAANEHARVFLNNGTFPSGVIEAPETAKLSAEAVARLKDSWSERYSGPGNVGKTPILEAGLKWKQSQINPEDAELLETRRFGIIEICRLFQVPPPIVQAYENNTFTNASQAGLWFGTFCLSPWARKLEAEFTRSVLSESFEMELDLSGFLRGDPTTRWNNYKTAVDAGILDPNEIRQLEGWNPRPPTPKTDEV